MKKECKLCKWSAPVIAGFDLTYTCENPVLIRKEIDCYELRKDPFLCGPNGKYWESESFYRVSNEYYYG